MKQRTWLITGINSGFGRHITEQLLEKGNRVAGTVRNTRSVDDLKEKYGDLLWVGKLDVTDTPRIYEIVNQAFKHFGEIDVIVSNAGYGLIGAAEELTIAQITHQISTNLLGSIHLIRAALPHLRSQGAGRIIQLSSASGQTAYPGASLYHASKWGIEGFCEAVSKEISPFNIGLTIVEPGGARTNFSKGSLIIGEKLEAYSITKAHSIASATSDGDPSKIAKVMIDSIEQDPAPLRITLGSGAYNSIHHSLSTRLKDLESQKELAFSTDFPTNES